MRGYQMISLNRLIICLVLLLSMMATPTFAAENSGEINQVKAFLFSSPTFKEGEKALNDKGHRIDRSKTIITDSGNGTYQVYLTFKGSESRYDIEFPIKVPEGKVSHHIGDPGDGHWSWPWIPIFW